MYCFYMNILIIAVGTKMTLEHKTSDDSSAVTFNCTVSDLYPVPQLLWKVICLNTITKVAVLF